RRARAATPRSALRGRANRRRSRASLRVGRSLPLPERDRHVRQRHARGDVERPGGRGVRLRRRTPVHHARRRRAARAARRQGGVRAARGGRRPDAAAARRRGPPRPRARRGPRVGRRRAPVCRAAARRSRERRAAVARAPAPRAAANGGRNVTVEAWIVLVAIAGVPAALLSVRIVRSARTLPALALTPLVSRRLSR